MDLYKDKSVKYCFMICLAIPGFQHLSREVKQTFGLFINVKLKDLILPFCQLLPQLNSSLQISKDFL